MSFIVSRQSGSQIIISNLFPFHTIRGNHSDSMKNREVFYHVEILHSWLELVRLPNLFTVPGDILVGAFLAGIAKNELSVIFPVIIISLSLYISGLILNDYADYEIDKEERPLRPMPSGRICPKTALAVSSILIGMALLISFLISENNLLPFFAIQRTWVFTIVLLLVMFILLYNKLARRIPWLSFIIMGLCRGLNVLLGAAIVTNSFHSKILYGAGIEALYIVSVSSIAYSEIKRPPSAVMCWLPFISLLTLGVPLYITGISLLKMCAFFITFAWIFYIIGHIRYYREQIPARIGDLIRSLLLIQCTLITIGMEPQQRYYHLSLIAFLLLLFFTSGLASRKFYSS
ncbi:MAG: UbiA family prenyltransferase [Candidatus Jettenia caeni]|nr:MAG: UbiA family prenyltransferase [Candidatus Jettenia caeni]